MKICQHRPEGRAWRKLVLNHLHVVRHPEGVKSKAGSKSMTQQNQGPDTQVPGGRDNRFNYRPSHPGWN
jgi:hypothetical protein